MKKFKDLRISVKLILGFAMVALLGGAMGVYAIINLKSLDDSSAQLYGNYAKPLGQVAALNENFHRMRVNLRDLIIHMDNAADITDYETRAKERAAAVDLNMAGLLASVDTEEGALLAEIQSSTDAGTARMDEYFSIIAKKDAAAAAAFIADDGAMGQLLRKAQDGLALLNTQLDAKAAGKAEANTAQAGSVMLVTIIIIAAMLTASILIGLGISRIVTKPIAEITQASKKFAAGDMDLQITAVTKDETGQLAGAFSDAVQTVKKMSDDIAALIGAISEGSFYARADESAYSGEYRRIIEGVNSTVAMFVSDFDGLPSPVLSIDTDFNVRYMNATGLSLLGKTAKEIIGSKCYDSFKTSDCQTENCACARAMKAKQDVEHETDAHPKKGIDLDIKYRGTPIIKDGKVVGAFEVVTDLTEVKQAKAAADRQSESLKVLLADVDLAAEQVSSGTNQVSSGSQAISQGATEQASSIEELSASIATIAEQIKENAVNAAKTAEVAESSKSIAMEGNDKMVRMLRPMEEINESSRSISNIIKVIDDIAFQTNILALNAAVEAARAGAHGKGFAVVAEEVRNLAGKSAKAAKETTDLIEGSIQKVAAGTKIANEAAAALTGIVAGAKSSVEMLEGIAKASNQQATGITEINRGIEQLSQVVQTNSATAEEAAAAAEELSGQAELLKRMVGEYDSGKDESPHVIKNPVVKKFKSPAHEPRIYISDLEIGNY